MTRRVVFVNRYYYPDVSATSQMLCDLAVRLARQGMDVHVVCSRQLYERPGADLPEVECDRGVCIQRVWTSTLGRGRLWRRVFDYSTFYFTAAARLLRLVRRDDVLVAKTDPPLISLVAALVASLRGARLVNWVQDVFPEVATRLGVGSLPEFLERMLRGLRDRSLAAAEANVVLGVRMQRHLQGRGLPPGRLHIIENWADAAAVHPQTPGRSELRLRLGLENRFVVAYSGNLGRAHDPHTILGAAELLRADPGIVFLMIGGGVAMAELRDGVSARRLANFVFLPYQPRAALADSLAAGDVHLACLLPALEGLVVPSKFYGALAAARPVIFVGDPDGELAGVIRIYECGRSVACGDSAGLAGLIRKLRDDEPARLAMGASARALFEAKYTAERGADAWSRLLQQVSPALRTVTRGVAVDSATG